MVKVDKKPRKLSLYLQDEYLTIAAMTKLYCRAQHRGSGFDKQTGLCQSCEEFLAFAHKKLALCPYGDDKPACSKCPIHCYGKNKRQQAIAIMRYAGPRMLLRHPIMAIKHFIQKRRAVPALLKK